MAFVSELIEEFLRTYFCTYFYFFYKSFLFLVGCLLPIWVEADISLDDFFSILNPFPHTQQEYDM